MSLYQGPKISTKGLVFAFDMSSNPGISKSWKGAPTTNLITNGHFANNTHVSQYTAGGSYGSYSLEYYPTNPGHSNYVLRQNGGTNGEYEINLTIAASTTYCVSCWVAYAPGSDLNTQILHTRWWYSGGNSSTSGAGTLYETKVIGSLTWERRYVTFTTPSNATGAFSWYLGYNTAGTQGYRYFTDLQVEIGSFPTPFVNGTRSSTTSLLDWAGGNTITLNGLQYNSDGTFQTSGATTTDYLSIANGALSAQASSGTWTLDFWLKLNARNSSLDHILQTGSGNNFLWFLIGNVLYFENTSQTNITLPTISTGTWFNLTMTGSGGSVQVYKNGSYVGAMTNTTTFSIASTIGIIMGQEMDSNSGAFAATQSYQGFWGATRFYNRPLTAEEVNSNFNAHRSRYGV